MSARRGRTDRRLFHAAVATALLVASSLMTASPPPAAAGAAPAAARPLARLSVPLQAGIIADERLRFRSLVTAMAASPIDPAELALVFADGSAAVIDAGRTVLRQPPGPSPVTGVRWLGAYVWDEFLLYARAPAGDPAAATYTVVPLSVHAPPIVLPCHDAQAVGTGAPAGTVTWRCGRIFYQAGLTPSARVPAGAPSGYTWTVRHTALTAAQAQAAGIGTIEGRRAVDSDGVVTVLFTGGNRPTLLGTLRVGPGPALIVWSPAGTLAIAGPHGVYLWVIGGHVRRFPQWRDVQQLVWNGGIHAWDAGTTVEVLDRLNPGALPPRFAVARLGLDGSAAIPLQGPLGDVLGLSADGALLWREEGVSPGVYTQGAAGAGSGPFALEALPLAPLAALPARPTAPLVSGGPTATAGADLAWLVAPHGGLLRSEDGGHTWTDAAPAGYQVAPGASGSPVNLVSAAPPTAAVGAAATITFLHATQCTAAQCYDGWAYAVNAAGRPTLLFTPDGGGSWTDLHPAGLALAGPSHAAAWPTMQFVTATDGWLAEYPCCQGMTETSAVALYRTADGGHRWTAVATVWTHNAGHVPPPGSPAPQGIPVAFGAQGPATAWITGVAPRQPWLYETTDGGTTWRNVRLTTPPGLTNASILTEPPQFLNAEDGVLPAIFGVRRHVVDGWQWVAAAEFAPQGHPRLVLYRTTDGGRTWEPTTPLRVVATTVTGAPAGVVVHSLTPRIAMVSDGVHLAETFDGGTTWTTRPLGSALPPVFGSASTGWLYLPNGGEPLQYTTDGGRTWRRQRAVIVPAVPPTLGAYTAPVAVTRAAVPGRWVASAGPAAHWSGTPLALSMGGPVTARSDATVTLAVYAQSRGDLSLTLPLTLDVRISMAEALREPGGSTQWVGGGPTVWKGTLPALPSARASLQMRFAWDQRDAAGHAVPPGTYFATLTSPVSTFEYSETGRRGTGALLPPPAPLSTQSYAETITIAP